MLWLPIVTHTGADPGFPIGGDANPPGEHQHMILRNFAKKCMKLRKFWAVGGVHQGHLLNPPLPYEPSLWLGNNRNLTFTVHFMGFQKLEGISSFVTLG